MIKAYIAVTLILIYAFANFFVKNVYEKNENVRKWCSNIAKSKILFIICPILWVIYITAAIFDFNHNAGGAHTLTLSTGLAAIGGTVIIGLVEVFIHSMANSHYEKGSLLDSEEKYAEAVEEFNKAIDLMKFNIPQKDLYLNEKAIALLKLQKISEAIECLKQAISINKRNSLYYSNLGYAYFIDDKYKLAEKNFETAIKKDKKDIDNKYYLCVIKNALGKGKTAFYIFKDIVTTLKKDKSVKNIDGTIANFLDILVDLKKEKEAEQFCKLASNFKINLYLYLGNCYYDEENYEKAIKYYKKALELSPNNADIYNNLGSSEGLNGNYEESIHYIEKAIELKPNNFTYYNNMAFSYFMMGEYLSAEKYYESTSESKKDKYDRRYYMLTKLALNKEDEAKNILIKDIEQLKKDKYTINEISDNFKNTIDFLLKKNKEEDCLRFCELAQKSGFVLYDYIADYYYRLLDYNKAVEYYTKHLEYEKKDYLYDYRASAKGCLKDYEGAIEDLKTAINLNPDKPEYYKYLASAYLKNGDYAQSEENFDKAKSLNADIYEDLYCVTKLMLNKKDEAETVFKEFINYEKIKNLKNEEHKKAIEEIKEDLFNTVDYLLDDDKISETDEFCELAIKYGFALYNFIGNYFKDTKKNYEKSIEYYTKHIDVEPDYYYAYGNRGTAKNWLKDYENAIEDLNKSIEINPDPFYYNERGNAKSWLNDFEGAIEDYNKAIELNSYDSTYYENRGNAKYWLKDYYGAIEDYNRAIKINPNNINYYNSIASTYRELGEYNNAIKTYTEVIDIDPKNTSAYTDRALCYTRLKQYKSAIKDLDKAVEIDSSNPTSYWIRASFYFYYADNYAMALNDCNYAINLFKNNKNVFNSDMNYTYKLKSRILFEKDKNRALDFLIEIENNCPNENKDDLYVALSYVFFSLDNYKKALKYANMAILKNQGNGTAYYRKKCALEAMGKHEEARECFEKAAKLGYREDF